jgi:hypothetical protein
MTSIRTTRRRLAFWIGFGLFSLGERTGVSALDEIAAATLQMTEPVVEENIRSNETREPAEHWTAVRNSKWRWYERENFVDGKWKLTGITTPIDRQTGARYTGKVGYIDEAIVPVEVLFHEDRQRLGRLSIDDPLEGQPHVMRKPAIIDSDVASETDSQDPEAVPIDFGDRSEDDAGRSNALRRSRHGRPPSKWLRSLKADEIRIWLAKVEIPDAHVEGMTFRTHLTRDHSFDPEKLEGLTQVELAELHGAAHEGF